MPAVLEELQSVESRRRKLVGRIVFGLMGLLSALIGALGGLLLIYSTDPPQVEHLENYRPISTTELYERHGHTIRTLALHRRARASSQDFPKVMRHALITKDRQR